MGDVEVCRDTIHGLFDGDHSGAYVEMIGRWICEKRGVEVKRIPHPSPLPRGERELKSLPAMTLPAADADDGVSNRRVNPCSQAVPLTGGPPPAGLKKEG